MNSTPSSDLVLKAENLHFLYQIDFFRKATLRDKFIDILSNPLETLTEKTEPKWIVKNASFEIKRGERVGILGVNGAGKTTLCRCLAGMLVPESGQLTLNGECRPIFNTSIGIYPDLTGRENAAILSKLIYPDLPNEELELMVEDILDFSELKEFVDVPFRNYSKGMQTRLFLSIVSARPSDLLIFDEVFDGADEFFQKKIANRFLSIMEQSGAVIFVSHIPEQIERTCNRVMVMHEHGIYFDGDVQEGIKKYRELDLNKE